MAKKKTQPNAKSLVIVESPAKARTISRYLGPEFMVESSIGHIRDLPSTAAEIPAEYKGEPWARLGVNVDANFEPLYVIPNDKKAQVRKLKSRLKGACALYLATDEDREGEAIAWHLTRVLEPKCPVKRMVFDEITKSTIARAVNETRDIDRRLVDAQETRRILDRLFGYEVSPVLWRKVKPKLSAGRVQSVATRLVVNRERARILFVASEYWDVAARLKVRSERAETVEVKLIELDGRRVAVGKDFDERTGELKGKSNVVLVDADTARAVAGVLSSAEFTVAEVTEKPFINRPYAPFITSTLQQEAARKLRFTARRTMQVAQRLYENGYITYMRTDSTQLSSQAINAARKQVAELYGQEYLPDAPRVYKRKSKNAQEAHEAIRPAGDTIRTPKKLAGELQADALRLYELIWKRTVASQMKDAQGLRTNVRVEASAGAHGTAVFVVSGRVITFPGFLRAYVEGADDPEAELEDQEEVLPPLKQGQGLDPVHVQPLQHTTEPPGRYSEASLIKELEERGIGRPSTYASIIQTIQDRGYVWNKGAALVPTFTAFAVINLLERHLPDLVDYEFTAKMENGLDAIANGEREAGPWLHDFYFGEPDGKKDKQDKNDGDHIADIGLRALIGASSEAIDPREVSRFPLGQTENGEVVAVRVGRYGLYVQIGDTDRRASVSETIPPDELTVDKALELIEQAAQGDRVIGQDPESAKPIYIKTGRFGPYVQLGDPELTPKGTIKRGTAPKRASLWPSMSIDTITLDQASMLLSYPRQVGVHPDNGEAITAQNGRFGPYLKMGDETRSLRDHEMLANVTLEEALETFKQPKPGRRSAAAAVLAELGKHPDSNAPIQAKKGRYGPYVTDGVVNATIPKDKDPATITLADALELIAAREQRLRDQGQAPRAVKSKKSTAKKKTATGSVKKKSAKKKTTKKRAAQVASQR
ncbi:MAG: type I DNA topoisomerase [Phycisphaerae bacterium]